MKGDLDEVILRNEEFGGLFFNQADGTMAFIDKDGFDTLMKFVGRKPLSPEQQDFVAALFDGGRDDKVRILYDDAASSGIKIFANQSENYNKGFGTLTRTPAFIDMSITNVCNQNCRYCYMSARNPNDGTYMSMEDFNFILDVLKNARVVQIAIGGGEPTLHPYFSEILRKLRINANIVPNYTTNGTNLTEKVLKASRRYCGAVATSYNENHEDQVLGATKLLIENEIKTNLHVVLLKSRLPKLTEITKRYADLGIDNVVFLLFKPIGRGMNLEREVLSEEDLPLLYRQLKGCIKISLKAGISIAFDACTASIIRKLPVYAQSVDGCNGARYSAYIDWNLQMKPCSFMQTEAGIDLRQRGIQEAWNSDTFCGFRRKLLDFDYEACESCSWFESCWGGCPIDPSWVVCEKIRRDK